MTLDKQAQLTYESRRTWDDNPVLDKPELEPPPSASNYAKDRKSRDDDEEELVVLEFSDPEEEDIVFMLPDVPGAPDAEDIEVDEGSDIEVAEEEE
jgi:hypothetical protein